MKNLYIVTGMAFSTKDNIMDVRTWYQVNESLDEAKAKADRELKTELPNESFHRHEMAIEEVAGQDLEKLINLLRPRPSIQDTVPDIDTYRRRGGRVLLP